MDRVKIDTSRISPCEEKMMYKILLSAVNEYFNNPNVAADYQKWLKEQEETK